MVLENYEWLGWRHVVERLHAPELFAHRDDFRFRLGRAVGAGNLIRTKSFIAQRRIAERIH